MFLTVHLHIVNHIFEQKFITAWEYCIPFVWKVTIGTSTREGSETISCSVALILIDFYLNLLGSRAFLNNFSSGIKVSKCLHFNQRETWRLNANTWKIHNRFLLNPALHRLYDPWNVQLWAKIELLNSLSGHLTPTNELLIFPGHFRLDFPPSQNEGTFRVRNMIKIWILFIKYYRIYEFFIYTWKPHLDPKINL